MKNKYTFNYKNNRIIAQDELADQLKKFEKCRRWFIVFSIFSVIGGCALEIMVEDKVPITTALLIALGNSKDHVIIEAEPVEKPLLHELFAKRK